MWAVRGDAANGDRQPRSWPIDLAVTTGVGLAATALIPLLLAVLTPFTCFDDASMPISSAACEELYLTFSVDALKSSWPLLFLLAVWGAVLAALEALARQLPAPSATRVLLACPAGVLVGLALTPWWIDQVDTIIVAQSFTISPSPSDAFVFASMAGLGVLIGYLDRRRPTGLSLFAAGASSGIAGLVVARLILLWAGNGVVNGDLFIGELRFRILLALSIVPPVAAMTALHLRPSPLPATFGELAGVSASPGPTAGVRPPPPAVRPPPPPPSAVQPDGTALCPYCAETIKPAALRCKHCGSPLGVAATPPTPQAPNRGSA